MKIFILAMMALALMIFLASAQGQEGKLIKTADVDNDGKDEVILENDYWRLVFEPDEGAIVATFLYKSTNHELNGLPGYTSFYERLWNDAQIEFLGERRRGVAEFEVKILENTAERGKVAFKTLGQTEAFKEIEFTKIFSLGQDSSALSVEYSLKNLDKAEKAVGLWSTLHLISRGQPCYFSLLTPQGIDEVGFFYEWSTMWGGRHTRYPSMVMLGRGRPERYTQGPICGWTAMRGQSGSGAALTADETILSAFRLNVNWNNWRTEVIFNQMPLAPGETFSTEMAVLPFRDMDSIVAAENGAVASLSIPAIAPERHGRPEKVVSVAQELPILVKILSATERKAKLVVKERRLPEGEAQEIFQKELELKTDEPLPIEFRYKPKNRGTTILEFEVSSYNKRTLSFEKPIIVEKASARFAVKREFKRKGRPLAPERRFIRPPVRMALHIPADYQPGMEVETPHIPWARPYYRGKTKALFIEFENTSRDIVELAQRLSLDYFLVMKEEPGTVIPSAQERLRQALKRDYHVIVFGGFGWTYIPEDLRQAILAKVKAGTGLLYIDPSMLLSDIEEATTRELPPAEFITSGVPLAQLPIFDQAPEEVVRCFQHGRGRIVFLNYFGRARWRATVLVPSLPGDVQTDLPETMRKEQYYCLLAKAVLWAARREPEVLIKEIKAPDEVSWDDAENLKVSIIIKNVGMRPLNVPVELVVNRWRPGWRLLRKIPVASLRPNQEKEVSFLVSGLTTGVNTLDFGLTLSTGKANWGTRLIRVVSDVEIPSLVVNKQVYEPGEEINGEVKFLNKAKKSLGILQVELRDPTGRILAVERTLAEVTPGEHKVPFRFRNYQPLTKLLSVAAVVRKDGKRVLEKKVEFPVRLKQDIPLRIAPAGPEFGLPFDLGFGRTDEEQLKNLARQNRAFVTWVTIPGFRIQIPRGTIREECLTDPEYLKRVKEFWTPYAKAGLKYGGLGYISSDEWGFGGEGNPENDYCHSPTCLAGFREFLKTEYGTLKALNAEWGTNYTRWKQVEPPLLKDVKKGKFEVAWVDHRRFTERVTADFFKFCNEEMHKIYPEMRIGLGGTPNAGSFNGYDWALLLREMPFVASYGGPQLEIIRSLKRPDAFITRWLGYDRPGTNEKNHRFMPWFAVLHGMSSAFYYIRETYSPLGLPDGRRFPKANWIEEEINAINKEGLGKLIKTLPRLDDGIAVHYSQSSIHAATLEGFRGNSRGLRTYNDNLSSLHNILEDLGLQYEFVSYPEIEEGALRNGRHKVLILPYSQAISKKEAEEIKEFVRQGGVIFGDLRTGICDEHGKKHSPGLLDDIFGIKHIGRPSIYEQGIVCIKGDEAIGFKGQVVALLGEPGLRLTTGKATAYFVYVSERVGVPALVLNNFGQGKAVYLNFLPATYSAARAVVTAADEPLETREARAAESGALRELFASIFRSAGIEPQVEIIAKGQEALPFSEIIRLGDEELTVIAILPSFSQGGRILPGVPAEINFPRKAHIYDLRTKKYFGETDRIEARIAEGKVMFFGLLSYVLEAPEIAVQPKTKPGDLLKFEINLKARGTKAVKDHIMRIQVFGPDGKERSLYGRCFVAKSGKYVGEIPLAINDSRGKWRIEVSEVISGKKGQAVFVVE